MELEMWLRKITTPSQLTGLYFGMLRIIPRVEIDDAIAHCAASIGTKLRNKGVRIRALDSLTAASAVERGMTLVTHNVPLYSQVQGLTVIDWTVP
jgi:predicted nucleic acid-binding protein